MTVFIGQVNKNSRIEGLSLGSVYNYQRFAEWSKEHQKNRIRIELDQPPTGKKRRFFEGAVVPYFFYQHTPGIFENFKEARDCLKREFNPVFVKRLDGKMETQGGSTAGKTDAWFAVFLQKIQEYFMENGYEYPDSQDYNKWVEAGPLIGEIYPPLERLVEAYKKKVGPNALSRSRAK